MKIIYIFLLILILFSSTLVAQIGSSTISKVGTSVAQFLKIQPSAKIIGMGGASSALSDDISTIFNNPAGLSRIYANEVVFSHIDWLVETDYDFIAISLNLQDSGTFGLMISTFGSGEMPVLTIEEPDGTGEMFDARDVFIGISYAKNLTEKFSIGATFKYINQRIWHMSSTGFAMDIGTLFTTPFWGIKLGASISNYGTGMRLDGRDIKFSTDPDYNNEGNVEFVNALYELKEYAIPLRFQVGISKELQLSEDNNVVFALDALNPNDYYESVNVGFEYGWKKTVFLRTGYKSLFIDNSEEGLTLGVGFNIRLIGTTIFRADYAYADFGRLENAQRFTFSLRF